MNTTFSDLGITKELTDALALAGITEPTAVQREVIPLIAAKKNIMFQSETGTGKTLAYLLPLIQRLETEENPSKAVKILIASPTYELAAQIKVQVQAVSKIKCALCIGGAPIARQIDMLKEKPQIVTVSPVAQRNSSKSIGYILILNSSDGIRIFSLFFFIEIKDPVSI